MHIQRPQEIQEKFLWRVLAAALSETPKGYRASVKYLITQEILELSNLSRVDKIDGNIPDFIIHQVGRATKTFQKTAKEKSLILKELINGNGPLNEIKRSEDELEAITEEIVNQERDKMSTWRLLNDEKPTRATPEKEHVESFLRGNGDDDGMNSKRED